MNIFVEDQQISSVG